MDAGSSDSSLLSMTSDESSPYACATGNGFITGAGKLHGSDVGLLSRGLTGMPYGRKGSNDRDGCYSRRAPRFISARSAAIAALTLSLLSLLLVLACAGIFFFDFDQSLKRLQAQAQALSSNEGERVCLPCIQVNPDPLFGSSSSSAGLMDSLERRRIPENDTEICCASSPAQYATLFKLILKRQEGVKKLADILGPSGGGSGGGGVMQGGDNSTHAVSAHLLIKPMPQELIDKSGPQAVQHWKSPSESPISHVREGLRLHDNRIFVNSPGLYFVYCQILYNRAETGSMSEDPPMVASNYVSRSSVLYPATSGILLKARHTRFNQDRDRHSSYVGGLFFLHQGDQLYVQVSVPELISRDDTASFFGLFKVGQ